MFGLFRKRVEARTLFGRLRSDVRGNTLAMMAIALIPLSALAGSGIDMARLYVVKVRLQQACDAGVLAGRKFMTDTSSSTLDANATAQANNFFNNNFRSGWMTTNTVVFTPSKTSDNQVSGTARAVVPMTIMKMFAQPDVTVNVTCVARYDVADTDVLFVLDTTGSMACLPTDSDTVCTNYVGAQITANAIQTYSRPGDAYSMAGYGGTTGYAVPEKSGSRIAALRSAVLSFYDAFAANADPSTKVRYGFVTYTSAVNMGKALASLNSSYLLGGNGSAANYNYQSRRITADYTYSTSSVNNTKTQTQCTGSVRTPATALTYNSSNQASLVSYVWTAANGSNPAVCKTKTDSLRPTYTYKQYPVDVSPFVAGNTITDPSRGDGATTQWPGCIEERIDPSSSGQSVFNTNALPKDIDPDYVPNSDATRWAPQWADIEYSRNGFTSRADQVVTDVDDSDVWGTDTANYNSYEMLRRGYTSCGKPVRRLTTWTRSEISNYVNATDFRPMGGTYHDTGMIWGTRMISPTGIFANDTAAWPNRNAPNRVIVFMTDGTMSPTPTTYSMYGLEYFDKRVGNGDYSTSGLTNFHNARFLAACSAAKARNIDVWTVAIDDAPTSQMQSCATTTAQALATTSGTGLSAAFATIAQHLAMLRLTK